MEPQQGLSWNQGDALATESLEALGVTQGSHASWAVIISHDCDLARPPEQEGDVELVLAEPIQEPDGNYQHAKNPRHLHIAVEQPDGEIQWLCLQAYNKRAVPKDTISPLTGPDASIPRGELHTFQHWLAIRYRRHALPDTLVERTRPLQQVIERRAKNKGATLIGIWIGYEPWGEELAPGDPYDLSIYVVHSAEELGAENVGRELAEELRQQAPSLEDVVLGVVESRSEQAFTLYDLRSKIQLRLEHISNRLGPDAPRGDNG